MHNTDPNRQPLIVTSDHQIFLPSKGQQRVVVDGLCGVSYYGCPRHSSMQLTPHVLEVPGVLSSQTVLWKHLDRYLPGRSEREEVELLPCEGTAKVEYEKDPERFEVRGSPITTRSPAFERSPVTSTMCPASEDEVRGSPVTTRSPAFERSPVTSTMYPASEDGKLWQVCAPPSSEEYYWNKLSDETTWTRPGTVDRDAREKLDLSANVDRLRTEGHLPRLRRAMRRVLHTISNDFWAMAACAAAACDTILSLTTPAHFARFFCCTCWIQLATCLGAWTCWIQLATCLGAWCVHPVATTSHSRARDLVRLEEVAAEVVSKDPSTGEVTTCNLSWVDGADEITGARHKWVDGAGETIAARHEWVDGAGETIAARHKWVDGADEIIGARHKSVDGNAQQKQRLSARIARLRMQYSSTEQADDDSSSDANTQNLDTRRSSISPCCLLLLIIGGALCWHRRSFADARLQDTYTTAPRAPPQQPSPPCSPSPPGFPPSPPSPPSPPFPPHTPPSPPLPPAPPTHPLPPVIHRSPATPTNFITALGFREEVVVGCILLLLVVICSAARVCRKSTVIHTPYKRLIAPKPDSVAALAGGIRERGERGDLAQVLAENLNVRAPLLVSQLAEALAKPELPLSTSKKDDSKQNGNRRKSGGPPAARSAKREPAASRAPQRQAKATEVRAWLFEPLLFKRVETVPLLRTHLYPLLALPPTVLKCLPLHCCDWSGGSSQPATSLSRCYPQPATSLP